MVGATLARASDGAVVQELWPGALVAMAVRLWLLRAAAVGLTAWAATTIDDARATQRLGALASAPQAVATSPAGRSAALTAADVLDRTLVVRLARPGRPFGALRLIPASVSRPGRRSPSDPRVVIGAGGRALLLWRSFDQSLPAPPFSRSEDCCDRLSAAVLDEAGGLGPARRLSAPAVQWTSEALSSIVGAVRGRRAAVAWRDPLGIRVALADRRGSFGDPTTLAGAGEVLAVRLAAEGPRVVAQEGGTVVELRAAGAGTVRRVLGSFPPRTSVGVAATAAGHMLLVGQREEGPDPYFTLRIAYRRGGGRLRFTNVRVPGGNLQPFAVAISGDGRGLVVTRSAVAGQHRNAVVVAVDRRGRPAGPREVPRSSGWEWQEFAVAVSSSGQALLAATGSVTRRLQRAFAWRMRLDGHRARRVTLLRDLSGGLPGGLGTGIDHAGRGIVAWGRGASLFARRVR
jgi:hypothetical protein